MKFFFPDAQDMVDPGFDFVSEQWSENRIRQRDDLYAHELFRTRAFDGLLVSKGIVDGFGEVGSRYSIGQRHRLLRRGVEEFFRLPQAPWHVLTMGDCGAFTYFDEATPPYTVDEVVTFYEACGFDHGVSVDHVILAYDPSWDVAGSGVPAAIHERQELTLDLARDFLKSSRSARFRPFGVAQGWSPRSYAHAVSTLAKMGYTHIALGGMVPMKSAEILACLREMQSVRAADTEFHLLGITRTEHLSEFSRLGVTSFDSTSPLRQAFKDDKDNYYTLERAFPAIRIPQVQGNAVLQRAISSGRVAQDEARKLERRALDSVNSFDKGESTVNDTISALTSYEELFEVARSAKRAGTSPRRRSIRSYADVYREVLEEKPWRACPCDVCVNVGIQVMVFRGAERNRRRGFHNTWVFYRRLRRELGLSAQPVS